MFPSVRRVLCAALLLAACSVSSCSDGGTDPKAPFGGDYSLQMVNGKPLPWTVTISGGTVFLTDMHLLIQSGGAYVLSATYTPGTYTGPVQNQAPGSYVHTPQTGYVALQNLAGLTWAVGTSSGNTLTLSTTDTSNPTVTYVFRR